MSAIIRAHENSWHSKCQNTCTFTHAHSVKWTCNRAAAEIEQMRRYLELPVHGGEENNSPPSYTDMGIGSALAELSALEQ